MKWTEGEYERKRRPLHVQSPMDRTEQMNNTVRTAVYVKHTETLSGRSRDTSHDQSVGRPPLKPFTLV